MPTVFAATNSATLGFLTLCNVPLGVRSNPPPNSRKPRSLTIHALNIPSPAAAPPSHHHPDPEQHHAGGGGSGGGGLHAAAELARLRIELDRARKCVACLSRDRDTLLFPCKHLVLCGRCYTRVVRQAEDDAAAGVDAAGGGAGAGGGGGGFGAGRCPTCRAEICGHLGGVVIN